MGDISNGGDLQDEGSDEDLEYHDTEQQEEAEDLSDNDVSDAEVEQLQSCMTCLLRLRRHSKIANNYRTRSAVWRSNWICCRKQRAWRHQGGRRWRSLPKRPLSGQLPPSCLWKQSLLHWRRLGGSSLGTKNKQTGFTLFMYMVGLHFQTSCEACESFVVSNGVGFFSLLLRRVFRIA